MNAKLDNPKTVPKTCCSIINKFLSNKKIPIIPPLLGDGLTSLDIKNDGLIIIIKNLNMDKVHGWDQLSIRMIKACGN